jgi:hypothetical protein
MSAPVFLAPVNRGHEATLRSGSGTAVPAGTPAAGDISLDEVYRCLSRHPDRSTASTPRIP